MHVGITGAFGDTTAAFLESFPEMQKWKTPIVFGRELQKAPNAS
jgi:hypothetical protein